MHVLKTKKCSCVLEVFVLDLGQTNQGHFHSALFWKFRIEICFSFLFVKGGHTLFLLQFNNHVIFV